MTSITIIPDVPNKKLTIAGDKIALGEKVFVSIPWTGLDVDVSNPYVRLRVEFAGKTIAITEDFDYQNEKFSGYLNLNTVPAMLLKGYPECKFILDNEKVPILYGTCIKELLPWRKEEGSDIPVDLTSYPDFVKKIEESNVSATKSGNIFQMNFAQGAQPGDIVSFANLGLSAGSVSVEGHGVFGGDLWAAVLHAYYGAEIQGTLSADKVVAEYVETTEIGSQFGNVHTLNIHPETVFHNKLKVLGDVEVFGNSGVVANDFTFNKGKSVKTELTSLSKSIEVIERTVIPDAINEVEKGVEESLKGYATTSDLAEERRRASAEEKALNDKVDKLVGEDKGKSARDIASEEVGKLIDGAPAAFDSFKEVAEYISNDKTAAQQMLASITQNKNDIKNALSLEKEQSFSDEEKSLASVNGGYRYLIFTPESEYETINGVEYLKYYVKDYAINVITIDTNTPVKIFLPSPVDKTNRCRDFIIKLKVTSEVIPSIEFIKSDVDETIGFESSDDEWVLLEPGINYFTFTETERT